MNLLNDLFSTDYGLMNTIGNGFTLCMAAYSSAHIPDQDKRAAHTLPRGKDW